MSALSPKPLKIWNILSDYAIAPGTYCVPSSIILRIRINKFLAIATMALLPPVLAFSFYLIVIFNGNKARWRYYALNTILRQFIMKPKTKISCFINCHYFMVGVTFKLWYQALPETWSTATEQLDIKCPDCYRAQQGYPSPDVRGYHHACRSASSAGRLDCQRSDGLG